MISDSFFKRYGCFLINLTSFLWLAFGFVFSKMLYFRDYSIIWEGTYRIFTGQMPYRDFGLPMGPGVFIFPLAAFKILGSTFDALILSQFFVACIALLFTWKLLRALGLDSFLAAVSTLLFSIYYSSATQHPWYNTSAFCFEIISLYLLVLFLNRPAKKFVLADVVSLVGAFFLMCLAFMTKQDFGAFGILIFVILICLDFLKHKDIKPFAILSFLAALVVSAFLWIWKVSAFSYWFNIGQFPHQSRVDKLVMLYPVHPHDERSLLMLLFFGCVGYFVYLYKIRKVDLLVLVSVLLVIQSYITYQTSGLSFLTSTYYTGFVLVLLVRFYRFLNLKQWVVRKSMYFKLACLVVFCVFVPKPYSFNTYRLWISGRYADFSGQEIKYPVATFRNSKYASFGGEYFSQDTVTFLNDNYDLIKSKVRSGDCNTINMTEFTPLASDLGFNLCKGMPLWYNTGISFFDREISLIENHLSTGNFDLIFIQSTHEPVEIKYQEIFSKINLDIYEKIGEAVAPAEHAPLYIYSKIMR